ncbi:Protein CBG00840 [Caenorhabditis briggsae]|uniref:Protein CBG00840 n=1 Tax=Caenorhabditis briggsae TaxID=6238 RepID=A8WNZ0_CAEBR|nr:Protein CBG00840 [Caenorhabditis briggsae]CAP22196.2 Protein CBG00840 [Caenorhabditis briggsae]
MILELIAPLENNTVPVCISGCARNWERVGGFSVYGVNGPGRLVSGRFRPIECSASSPFSCAEASNKAYQGLCQGDYGGSAIANIDQRYVMLGFYAGDNEECQGNTENMDPFKFVNLGHYRQEICETTGVCVPPCEVDVTPGPQSPIDYRRGAYTTTAEEEPTLEVLSTDPQVPYEKPGTLKNTTAGEEIKAETFAPLIVSNSSTEGDVTNAEIFDPTRIGFDGEVIKAETFEPMEIDHRGSTRADRIRDIHIHIHLNK